MGSHRPTDDPPAVGIEDEGKIHEAPQRRKRDAGA
jgi:hypothetical protein